MKAVLNVKGTKLSVVGLNYYGDAVTSAQALDANGNVVTYHDASHGIYTPGQVETVNMKEALIFPDASKQIVEDINQLIEDSEQHLTVLGNQIIQEVLVHNGLPFGDSALPNLVKEYKEHKDYIDGVASALEVVKASGNND